MGLNTMTLGLLNWGDSYWSRFGERFFASVAKADPQPDNIVIATDRILEGLPSNVNQIIYKGGFMGVNLIARECDTTWMLFAGLDDEMLPGAFLPVESDADAISYPAQQVGETHGISPSVDPGVFANCWKMNHNPMTGAFIFRCSTMLEIPARDYIYHDDVLFAEWSYFGKKIDVDNRFRLLWHRWSGANSWPANRAGESQALEFKQRLRAGLIKKGVPE